jgi:hypothetical protein
MIPFAARTYMFDEIKKANAKASGVDVFMATLLSDHDAVGARAQLKTVLAGHVCELLDEDDEAPLTSGGPELRWAQGLGRSTGWGKRGSRWAGPLGYW